MKILIVDDEYYARKAMIKMLKEWDRDIIITGDVETGIDAIERIEAEVPDLVFSDIRMPDMDGIMLARHIDGKYPSCAVFIVSGYSDLQNAREEEIGAVKGFLTKPVKKVELFSQLDAFNKTKQG